MRHITDGELHAYLDGALDLLPEGRGEEVREHLGACPACEERLEDETRVRTGARDLLARAAPEETEIPSFEEIRARAEALEASTGSGEGDRSMEKPRRKPLEGIPLAWAASIVLALGVGWMGGKVWRQIPHETETPFISTPTDALPAVVTPESGLASRVLDSGEIEGEAEPAPRQTAPSEPGSGQGMAEERTKAVGSMAGDSPATPATLMERRDVLVEESPVEEEGKAAAGLTPSLAFPSAAPELMEADDLPPDHSLAVPGLKLLSVEWEEWIPGEQSLRIRQLLPMGDTLELRYLNMLIGTDPAARTRISEEGGGGVSDLATHPTAPKVLEASLPPGWKQVVMRKGRMWLVARAPISEDQLRALLRSLR